MLDSVRLEDLLEMKGALMSFAGKLCCFVSTLVRSNQENSSCCIALMEITVKEVIRNTNPSSERNVNVDNDHLFGCINFEHGVYFYILNMEAT